ncbi:MAG: ABC transporter permease [Bacilli bacterium]|nr:ABC transporter permease [Bacilli bacterium]
MMQLLRLVKGEAHRFYKYKILHISLLVSIIWIALILLLDEATISEFVPLLVMMDAAMMSIILMASSYFFEKQENTIRTTLVLPIHPGQILLAKIICVTLLEVLSGTIILLTMVFAYGTHISFLLYFIYIILVVLSHTSIGMFITLHSKDFNSMLTRYMLFAFVTIIPTFLASFNIIPESWELLLAISPTQGGQWLIQSLFTSIETPKIIFSVLYLLAMPLLVYPLAVYPRYKKVIMGE